ncbi:hypothetical protein DPMN_060133 [Dreissena polymorpha]|uniref:NACHT domain-containing protein n=1 Tax=Dreissena polymorpha TaxID=45954 RepID=A0A9D4HH98_DREPO|nr:hypothetical protein DPMN_060133 [Dreissena polymorpha]
MEGSDAVSSATEAGLMEVNATVIKGQQVIESVYMKGRDAVTSATEAGLTEVNVTVIKGQQVIESVYMEGRDEVTSATEAGLTDVNATVIQGQQDIESATMEGRDKVTSATEAGVTEVNVTVIKGLQVIESATIGGCDAVTFATEAGLTEVYATVIKGQQVIESTTIEGSDAVTSSTEAGLTEVNATVIQGQQDIEFATIEGSDAISSATEAGLTEVNGKVIQGQQDIESVAIEGREAVTSATGAGVTEVNATVIKGQQVIELATMDGCDAVTFATGAGVTEVNATVIKGQNFIESATIEVRDDINFATEAGVKEVIATMIKGKDVIELATIEGCDAVTSATEAAVTEVNVTVIQGQQDIESATMKGLDAVTFATLVGVNEINLQTKTHLSKIQSICAKEREDLIGIKTQTDVEDFALQCNDLLRRLIEHYRDSVICVPLSTLNPSLDIRVQDIYATPKIHRMKIEKDGKHVKQEQIYKYKDCFCGGARRLYLQGEPGSGKSYFAAKLIHDWCNVYALIAKSTKEQMMFGDVDTLQKFRFLFFISLRESREQTHVTQMIKTQLIHKIYAENKWESAYELVLKIMENVMYLVVQDGLDEWPGKHAVPSMDGIPKDHCIMLTTSRPWKLADERIKNSQIDILLEVEGISDPRELNEKILRCLLDESTDIQTSLLEFECFLFTRNLEWLSSSPMLNTLALCTWVEDRAERLTGSSLCELYTTMLENLCKKANPQKSYFDRNHPSPVNCFSRTMYIKPNLKHIDAIAKAAFSFLFSNDKESSLVFSDIHLMAHLPETAKQFALDSGLLSKRKGKKCTDQTLSFVHKTIQEFLTAFHIHRNADVIHDVISGYFKRHDNSYRDISQMFIFLCGFNISAANKLSALINEHDVYSDYDHYFHKCIISGYKEAVANKNTPIHLHLSHFYFDNKNAEDLIQIWTLNTPRARSLRVGFCSNRHLTVRSKDAVFRLSWTWACCLSARKDPRPSTLDDEEGVRSSTSCIEFDLSSCHNLEVLFLNGNITVLPNALVGLKKLKHLTMTCKCEALDLSHFQHIESIEIYDGVTLLPLSFNNYKTLQCITLLTTYDGLDLSLFENLKSIAISNKVKVLPKQQLIHNKLTLIDLRDFDFNRVDHTAIHTWCLLNGADPFQCADYTPVQPSITDIKFCQVTCSSTWLRNLLSTMLTIDHKVECSLNYCKLTSLDHEINSTLRGSTNMSSCEEDAASESYTRTTSLITTHLNNTCTFDIAHESPCLWETLHGLNIKNLSLQGRNGCLNVHSVSSLAQSLTSLPQLETLTMYLSVYIDLQLPPSLKNLTACYNILSPSDLRHLGNKLCALTQSVDCRLEFGCGNKISKYTVNNIQLEEYIPIQQELKALENVEVKRFRIYDRKPNTYKWSNDAWSVRDSVVDDDDNNDDIGEDELFKWYKMQIQKAVINRISIRLHINCVKEQALIK